MTSKSFKFKLININNLSAASFFLIYESTYLNSRPFLLDWGSEWELILLINHNQILYS